MSVRTERVGGEIRAEIAGMLLRGELRDPRLGGLVSVTAVKVSPDLQQARVFISVMGGSEGSDQATLQALRHAAGFVQAQLGKRLRLRFIPHLEFVLDQAIAQGHHMNQLLASLHIPPAEDDQEAPTPSDEEE